MNNEMWSAVFLTRTCALAGGERAASTDATEDAREAFERWKESRSLEDLLHSIDVSVWNSDVWKHYIRTRDARWAREDRVREEHKERVDEDK